MTRELPKWSADVATVCKTIDDVTEQGGIRVSGCHEALVGAGYSPHLLNNAPATDEQSKAIELVEKICEDFDVGDFICPSEDALGLEVDAGTVQKIQSLEFWSVLIDNDGDLKICLRPDGAEAPCVEISFNAALLKLADDLDDEIEYINEIPNNEPWLRETPAALRRIAAALVHVAETAEAKISKAKPAASDDATG